jgi:hypothetical protein
MNTDKPLLGILAVSLLVEMAQAGQTTRPIVTGFTPSSALVGATVEISGLNFNPVATNNIVHFGAVQGVVTAASVTNLTVSVPVGATYAPITETVNGLTAYSDRPFLPTFVGVGQIDSSSLAPRLDLPAGSGAQRVVIADLDGDGKPDLVIADGYAGDIAIYQNISTNGRLAFIAPPVVLTMVKGKYNNPLTVAVVDVDGDGKIDIIALNSDSNIVSIFRNIASPGAISTNSFADRVDIPAGVGMTGLAVQDLDGDGKPDIVTANSGDNTISAFHNLSTNGVISFSAGVSFATGNFPNGLAIADLDEDGSPDVVVANRVDGTVSVFRNLGLDGEITTNSFASRVDLQGTAQCTRITIGDVDGDGKLDILVANWTSDSISIFRNLTVTTGITTNSFAPRVDFALGGWGHDIALADLDGDGKPDVVVVTEINSMLSVFHNASSPGSLTADSLGCRVDFPSGWNAWGVSCGDLDGDGRPDIVFANTYDSTISIYHNTGLTSAPPSITIQPQGVLVDAHANTSFIVTAQGATPLSYQWTLNGSSILGASSNTLTITNVTESDLGVYAVVVTNFIGSVTSSNALLSMYPFIAAPFSGAVTYWGKDVTLSVEAWGTGPLSYQWLDNGIPILNATNSQLMLTSIQFTNAGLYSVVVSSPFGIVTNTPAQVVVNPAGVSLGIYPGVTVSGVVGFTYDIQSSLDLTDTNGWTTVATVTLSNPVQLWVDVNVNAASPTNRHRFYRVLPGP